VLAHIRDSFSMESRGPAKMKPLIRGLGACNAL